MTDQHQKKLCDKNIQEMIQTIIRRMISRIVQQNVIAITTINAASNSFVNRSNSLQQFVNQSQITFKSTSESRSNH